MSDEPALSPPDPDPEPSTPALVRVIWTQKGGDMGAWSEHGPHKTGDIVDTAYADILIERGFAERVT